MGVDPCSRNPDHIPVKLKSRNGNVWKSKMGMGMSGKAGMGLRMGNGNGWKIRNGEWECLEKQGWGRGMGNGNVWMCLCHSQEAGKAGMGVGMSGKAGMGNGNVRDSGMPSPRPTGADHSAGAGSPRAQRGLLEFLRGLQDLPAREPGLGLGLGLGSALGAAPEWDHPELWRGIIGIISRINLGSGIEEILQ